MPEGKIKKVVAEKGFGFISNGQTDLFFHHSELRGIQIEELAEGQSVRYEIGEGKKGPCAVAVQASQLRRQGAKPCLALPVKSNDAPGSPGSRSVFVLRGH
jgi:CspA family cold shock protein